MNSNNNKSDEMGKKLNVDVLQDNCILDNLIFIIILFS